MAKMELSKGFQETDWDSTCINCVGSHCARYDVIMNYEDLSSGMGHSSLLGRLFYGAAESDYTV
jgi:hypothetical protein